MTEEKCLCESTEILIFPCSGGSNVGQIANEAAKNITTLGHGKMYCLAGIGGHISGITESTKTAKKLVAIDGCPVSCAKKTLEHAGFKPDVHVVVNDLDIKKNYDFMMDVDEIKKVTDKVIDKLQK
ncbi:MAG: putative zinc-binding protein [Petrotogales bacterium]